MWFNKKYVELRQSWLAEVDFIESNLIFIVCQCTLPYSCQSTPKDTPPTASEHPNVHRLDYLGIVTNCYQLLLKFTLVSPNATRNYFWYPLTGVLFYLFPTAHPKREKEREREREREKERKREREREIRIFTNIQIHTNQDHGLHRSTDYICSFRYSWSLTTVNYLGNWTWLLIGIQDVQYT